MDLSTKVNIVLSVLSFILAVISIVTVVITLRQNNKMIENSSRLMYVFILITYNAENQLAILLLRILVHLPPLLIRLHIMTLYKIIQNHLLIFQPSLMVFLGIQ